MRQILKREKLFFLVLGVVCLLCTACMEPVPLYGTFMDNKGNKISFFEDGTFNAKVVTEDGSFVYEGNYSVLLNALTLVCTNVTLQVVTEWDISGNFLYLDWTDEKGNLYPLRLGKISN